MKLARRTRSPAMDDNTTRVPCPWRRIWFATASAVEAPTDLRNARRVASCGNTARITAEATTFDEASDYAAFVDAGIPSAGILTGDEDEMTPAEARQWNGRPGTVFDSCYHSACDRIENVNTTALDRFADATAGTVAHFAVSTDALPN